MGTTSLAGSAEVQMAIRAFLESPAATRVAAGRSTENDVEVVSYFNDARGRDCRVVEQVVTIGTQPVRARGTVCQDPGGRWALVP
jgi:surface antigen